MNIVNKTSFPVVAVCWHKQYGYGDEETVEPGQSKDILGPYLGKMGGVSCHLSMSGKIACHKKQDDESGFHVSDGNQLNLGSGELGVTIRHYSNDLALG